jgi:ribonuclease BN (tRNA processing enzyme)
MSPRRRPPLLPVAFITSAVAGAASGCAPGSSPPPQEEPRIPPSEITQVVLLGTGTPNAEPDRWGSAVAIVVNGTPYLVDAGAGVVRRASAAFSRGVEGLEVKRLATVFLTHLHSDHTVGLPDLIYTPWVLERESPLRIVGPPGTEAMAFHLTEAYEEDVRVRIEGSEPINATGHLVEARDTGPGVVWEDGNVRVTAFEVAHGDWAHAFGYRFETPDRVVVVSGDTRPTDAVADRCNGCDILIHEVYSQAGFERRPPEWQAYHAASHTSAPALGRIASRARPRLLVLTHQLLWGSTPEELLAEVRGTFDGPVVYGKDLDIY